VTLLVEVRLTTGFNRIHPGQSDRHRGCEGHHLAFEIRLIARPCNLAYALSTPRTRAAQIPLGWMDSRPAVCKTSGESDAVDSHRSNTLARICGTSDRGHRAWRGGNGERASLVISGEAIDKEQGKSYSARAIKVRQCTSGNFLDAFNLWKRFEKMPY